MTQCTQVFSMNGRVTKSLIRLAIVKTDEEIETLHASAVQLTRGADRTLVVNIAKSICKQFEKYVSEVQLELNCYNESVFLVPRVFHTSSKEQKSKTITDIKGILCSKTDCDMNKRPNKQASESAK